MPLPGPPACSVSCIQHSPRHEQEPPVKGQVDLLDHIAFRETNPVHLASIDSADQEGGRLVPPLVAIGEMWSSHDQAAGADQVSDSTEDLEAVGRVVGNLAVVLLVLGVAEEDDALDLLADGGATVADGGGSEGGTLAVNGKVLSVMGISRKGVGEILPVSSGHDLGIGAFGVGRDKMVLHLGDGPCGRAVRQEVVEDARRIGTAYSLDPDICSAIFCLEDIGDRWSQ